MAYVPPKATQDDAVSVSGMGYLVKHHSAVRW